MSFAISKMEEKWRVYASGSSAVFEGFSSDLGTEIEDGIYRIMFRLSGMVIRGHGWG